MYKVGRLRLRRSVIHSISPECDRNMNGTGKERGVWGAVSRAANGRKTLNLFFSCVTLQYKSGMGRAL